MYRSMLSAAAPATWWCVRCKHAPGMAVQEAWLLTPRPLSRSLLRRSCTHVNPSLLLTVGLPGTSGGQVLPASLYPPFANVCVTCVHVLVWMIGHDGVWSFLICLCDHAVKGPMGGTPLGQQTAWLEGDGVCTRGWNSTGAWTGLPGVGDPSGCVGRSE